MHCGVDHRAEREVVHLSAAVEEELEAVALFLDHVLEVPLDGSQVGAEKPASHGDVAIVRADVSENGKEIYPEKVLCTRTSTYIRFNNLFAESVIDGQIFHCLNRYTPPKKVQIILNPEKMPVSVILAIILVNCNNTLLT